ncbi:YebG family protein [Pelagibaculum spongiae]|uniref:Multidrug DMT transporter permease n=1 Tax=Pelagibaculum spongiae TaxID=2080658 RepID=A0A2V1GQA0_9GAMM|nr:YebG family protein [Pelagibaculum spongiae]PVZ65001.1 hypothetical protein DC094_18835 [Pelagibaculum spongiae]
MAVIVRYIVERNGVEMKAFSSKKEADAYDRQLEIAEKFSEFLDQSGLELNEDLQEELGMYLAEHAEQAVAILKGQKEKKPASAPKPAKLVKSA